MSWFTALKKRLKKSNTNMNEEAAAAPEGDTSSPESAFIDQATDCLVPSESPGHVHRRGLSISDLLERRESVSHLFPVIGEPVKSPGETESMRSRSSSGLSAVVQMLSSATQKLASPKHVESSDPLLDDAGLSWTDTEIGITPDASPRDTTFLSDLISRDPAFLSDFSPRDTAFLDTPSPTACTFNYPRLLHPPKISVTTFLDDSLDLSTTTAALDLSSLEDEQHEKPTSERLALMERNGTSSESSDGHVGRMSFEYTARTNSGLDDFQTAWIGCSYRFIIGSNKLLLRLTRMGQLAREITTGQEIKVLATVCLMPGSKQLQSLFVGHDLDESEPHEEDIYFHSNLNDVGNMDINIQLSAPLGRFRKQKTFSNWTLHVYGTDLILGSTEWKLIESDGKFV